MIFIQFSWSDSLIQAVFITEPFFRNGQRISFLLHQFKPLSSQGTDALDQQPMLLPLLCVPSHGAMGSSDTLFLGPQGMSG